VQVKSPVALWKAVIVRRREPTLFDLELWQLLYMDPESALKSKLSVAT